MCTASTEVIFMNILHPMYKCILFLENPDVLSPHFLICYEKKMTALQIYMPCSGALEMHIQQGTKRFRERETALTHGQSEPEERG